ncbi:pseudaminic acid cytidylyltransferase [Gammaproteobacteria bacterium]|nr:pseudaminic acid cytidylyltransferase [Gammaproteobacteria bacterium]
MIPADNVLVVVPARGGSKRIPKKNIKLIAGQPMIFWPLMEISKLFDASNVIVSTDDHEIADKVASIGLKTPFKRPKKLSDDYTGTFEVTNHALDWYEKEVGRIDYVLTVYPTAVLLSSKDIINAINLLKEDTSCDMVMSATNFPFPIGRAVFTNKDGYAEMFQPENYLTRSQDLAEAFHDAGQFYVSKAHSIRTEKIFTSLNIRLQHLHRNNVVDIDTPEDFEVAEEKLNFIKSKIPIKKWSF